jgi:hypothetical protein
MLLAPAAVLVALSLLIGIFAQGSVQIAQVAANQAIDRAAYIAAVAPQEIEQATTGAEPALSALPEPAQQYGGMQP